MDQKMLFVQSQENENSEPDEFLMCLCWSVFSSCVMVRWLILQKKKKKEFHRWRLSTSVECQLLFKVTLNIYTFWVGFFLEMGCMETPFLKFWPRNVICHDDRWQNGSELTPKWAPILTKNYRFYLLISTFCLSIFILENVFGKFQSFQAPVWTSKGYRSS